MKDTTIAILTVGMIAVVGITLSTVFKSEINSEIIQNAFLCIGSLTGGVAIGRGTKKKV